jgi:hypothetical protein
MFRPVQRPRRPLRLRVPLASVLPLSAMLDMSRPLPRLVQRNRLSTTVPLFPLGPEPSSKNNNALQVSNGSTQISRKRQTRPR